MEQQREQMSNTQSPLTENTSGGLGQQNRGQQGRNSSSSGLGSERSSQRGSEHMSEESGLDRDSSI
jgi:hypothetical protein